MRKNQIILPPIHPNAGLEVLYREKLDRLIMSMHRSVLFWVTAAYRANLPEMAQDDQPRIPISAALAAAIAREGNSVKVMELVMKILGIYWTKRYYQAAPKLAEYFATKASQRVDGALKTILKDSGFMVDWKMSTAQQEVLDATISEQVALIKSIPQQYLSQVEGMVMRSVQAGGDLKTLTDQLGPKVDLSLIGKGRLPGESKESLLYRTRKRAAFIASDQNNKANAMITRVRQIDLGLDTAILRHSHGGKTPRPTHVAMDGKKYKIAKGFYDKDAHGKGKGDWVLPGQLPRCRCVGQAVITGREI